jgi:hypothetical protein
MSSNPLSDFMLNLAAGLTQTLLEAGSRRMRQAALGTDEDRSLRAALEQGFAVLLAEADSQLPPGELRQETAHLVGDIFTAFVAAPEVADNLLAFALAGAPPDMLRLAAAFAALEFDCDTLPVDFERCLSAYHRGLTDALVSAAKSVDGPLFQRVSLEKAGAILALLEDHHHGLAAISEQVRSLESGNDQTTYNIVIQQAISPIAIGDHAQASQSVSHEIRDLLQEILALLSRGADGGTSASQQVHLIKQRFATCTSENLPSIRPGIRGVNFTHPQFAEVANCVEERKVVSLTGGPGVGKSSIASDLARSAANQGNTVLFIDARQVAHLRTARELQDFVHLDVAVADAITVIAQVETCLLIIDQLDSVVGMPQRLLLNLARSAANTEGVRVLAVVRTSEDSRQLVEELTQSTFVSIVLQPLPMDRAQGLLSDLGIDEPGDALLSLATTPLNLDLIAHVYSQLPAGATRSIVTEVELWRAFFDAIERQETTIENPDAGRQLRAAAHELAWQCQNEPDRGVSLRIDSTRTQRRLIEWDILLPVGSGARRYRFRHEQLQDYLIAEDTFAERLTPDQLLQRIDPHRALGIVDWLAKLYAQSAARDNVWFLQSYLDPHTSLPFFSQTTVLGNYMRCNVSSEPPEVIDAILDAVRTVTGMRQYFFAGTPHPSWAPHLWNHGFYATPPSPQTDAQGRQYLGHWDAQRYLISVASQAPDVVMRHAMTINGYGWYICWALEALCSIPPSMALPITERIVSWLSDPEVAREIDHPTYQLLLRFASAGEADAAFAIFTAMIAPRTPFQQHAPSGFLEPSAVELQSDYYELFSQEQPLLAKANLERLVATLSEVLRSIVTYCSTPDSYQARHAYWRSAIEDTDQDIRESTADKLLGALRNSYERWLELRPDSVRVAISSMLDDDYVIFRRLAIHLIAHSPHAFPHELTTLLLERDHYDDESIHHEFLQLLKSGFPYLDPEGQSQAIGLIQDGMGNEGRQRVLEWVSREAERDPNTELETLNKSWIRDRLFMIGENLPGDAAQNLARLIEEVGEPERPEFLSWVTSGTWTRPASPLSHAQISSMSLVELIDFLGNWTSSERTRHLRDESFDALIGSVARALLTDTPNREQDIRDLAAVDLAYALPFLGHLENKDESPTVPWGLALALCEQSIGQSDASDQDRRTHVRRVEVCMNVLRLLERGLEGNTVLPSHSIERVRALLFKLAEDIDPTPADDNPVDGFMGHNDPLTLSFNHVRPRALALLIRYAVHLSRTENSISASTTTETEPVLSRLDVQTRALLDAKLDVEQEPSWAVRSVYGQYLQTLFWLDAAWVMQNLDRIFAESSAEVDTRMFVAAWDGFVVSGRSLPLPGLRTLLYQKYLRAIDNLAAGRVTKGLDPARRLAEHVAFDYLHSEQVLASESPGSASLVAVFFAKAPRDSRSRVAWSIWQACIQNPQGFWRRASALWYWRVEAVRASGALAEFADEMTYYAQLPFAVREFVAVSAISDVLKETLRMSGLSDQRGLGWTSVEQYLAHRIGYEPRVVCDFMSWLIDLAPNPQSTKAIETRRAILENLAANQHTRASALDMIDRLARMGIQGYHDIYQRHR